MSGLSPFHWNGLYYFALRWPHNGLIIDDECLLQYPFVDQPVVHTDFTNRNATFHFETENQGNQNESHLEDNPSKLVVFAVSEKNPSAHVVLNFRHVVTNEEFKDELSWA